MTLYDPCLPRRELPIVLRHWLLPLLLAAALPALAVQTCPANNVPSTPGADFTINGDGTVTHGKTGLVWQRCLLGQTWDGTTCSGSASTHTWANALQAATSNRFAGQGDWRLPNIKEVLSIVERSCYSPAINATLFPNPPVGYLWSATSYVVLPAYAWAAYFGDGTASTLNRSNTYAVRLVRDGDILAAFDGEGDFVPDAFSFANQSGLPPSSPATSAAITIGGIDTVSPVTVSGGSYAINGGNYTTAAGAVRNGDSVSLRHTSAASGAGNGDVTTTLTIGGLSGMGGVSASFTSITVDTVPPMPSALGISGTALWAPVLTATSNEAAIGYWLVLPKGAPAPSAAQVKLGLDAENRAALGAGSAAMAAPGPQTFSLGNLAAGSSYQLHFVASDNAGNDSSVSRLVFSLGTGLNDSGLATCADAGSNDQPCIPAEPTGFTGQDGRHGRDAAAAAGVLYKIGGGSAGFDFTKIANDGSDLPATATLGGNPGDWACTRDNTTGLTWEVKTTSGVHSQDNVYYWGDTSLKNAANGAALCGFTDWRVPNAAELVSLVDFSRGTAPAIDGDYFPNTRVGWFWTSDTSLATYLVAWQVSFNNGAVNYYPKDTSYSIRLVRGGL